jgi:hypothetical protein
MVAPRATVASDSVFDDEVAAFGADLDSVAACRATLRPDLRLAVPEGDRSGVVH